jgi:GAF domain-containing protein
VICAAEDITERKLAEEQITRLNSVLRAIRNVNELLVTEKDRDRLLRKSCDALIDARGYDAVWLGLLEDGKRFVEVVGSGFPEDVSRFIRHVISGDNPPCIRDALASEETVLVMDKSRECKDCFFKDACRGREATILRVEHAGRFFGLLAVLLAPDVAVDDEEKSLLAEVASDIAIGLHDIEMMGILREREQIVRKQNEMLMELAKCKELYSGDLADSLRIVTEATAHAVEVERVSVWLYEGDRSMIRCIDLYTMSTDSHSEGMVLAAADYPSYFEALEEGAFIAAHDAHKDPRTNEFSDSYLTPLGIKSMMDVPIRLKGAVVGVVCYEHVGHTRRWTMEEENFARSPADYISLAMEADERRRAEEALRHATLSLREHVVMLEESNKRAEEASRLREHFLKETSHRIITPVAIVGGYSKWLLRWSNNLDKDQRAKIRLICERNEEVQTLVRDALEEKYLEDMEQGGAC